MRARVTIAFGAVALAFALLVPAMAPLPGSVDALASDLANGTFRPFGPLGGSGSGAGLGGLSTQLGGITGSSGGNFVPGLSALPPAWALDRDGAGGLVTIDYVFSPALGAMKRLKAYDRILPDGVTLAVTNERLSPIVADSAPRLDIVFTGEFRVALKTGEPVPVYSPHPKAIVVNARTDVGVPVTFLKDGADTFHVLANHDGIVTLNVTYRASSDYFSFAPPRGFRVSDYVEGVRPVVPVALREEAQLVLARAGAADVDDVATILHALNAYFRDFEEGIIPSPEQIESLYLALAVGGKGCCRHRAFAYMITAQAAGIPTRVVINEAHAFVEVMLPNHRWHQINLGGCGSYRINNPRALPTMFNQASDPRREANPDEGRPVVLLPSETEITESPARIMKGERYTVNGTVRGLDGRPVAFARVDVFLNTTKETPGRLTGAGVTGADGRFSVEARVPADLPARSYQLVAKSADGRSGDLRYDESWSDPPVDVFAGTRLELPARHEGAVGYPLPIRGRLVDIEGNPVATTPLTWTLDGAPQSPLRTDARGRFTAIVESNRTGDIVARFSFAGTEHYGPAEASSNLSMRASAIVLPSDPIVLVRGASTNVTGVVVHDGAAAPGIDVRVTVRPFATSANAPTDTTGSFRVAVPIPASVAPGPYTLRIEAPELGLAVETLAAIALRPVLTLSAPETVGRDVEWDLAARLVTEHGAGVGNARLELVLDGNASTRRVVYTDADGLARFVVPGALSKAGLRQAAVAFPGNTTHLAVHATAAVEVLAPREVPIEQALLAVGAVAFLGLALWVTLERRNTVAGAARATLAALRPHRVTLMVRFPEHPEGIAPVFEPGERAVVEIEARDTRGDRVAARVRLVAPDTRRGGRTTRTEPARFDVTVPEDAPFLLTASGRGPARLWTPALHLTIPVGPYRKAVEDAFVELRRRARLTPTSTAGDLVRAVSPRLAPEARRALLAAANLFDVADYSQTPVDRAFYHRFSRARRDVEAALQIQEAARDA